MAKSDDVENGPAAEDDEATTGAVQLSDAEARARRRARIHLLIGKKGRAGGAARPQAGGRGAGGFQGAAQNMLVQRAQGILTETEADEDGMVPDTSFTVAGVKKLIELLRTRSEAEGRPGAKMAKSLLKFLSTSDDSEAQVEGVSVAKLQRIAKFAERGRLS